jgi:hypothetical protein
LPSLYRMTLSLNVLNHLGINLYSNIPAVLSEVVANAWDADAELVDVKIDKNKKTITITDDGHGMNTPEINAKFLTVGYRRREDGQEITPKHSRKVMGRKGIGKLSLFSIAKKVDVYSVRGKSKNAFRMDVDQIKSKISKKEATYRPEELDTFPSDLKRGTRIVLSEIKKEVFQTEPALRKRLARRFSILGAEYHFRIRINKVEVTVADRDYFHRLQFMWTYGEQGKLAAKHAKKLEQKKERDNTVLSGTYSISGWIGTVREAGDLKDQYDNLNKIVIMVRGKLAQEDILDSFSEGGIYTKYLIGEIHADFLDDTEKEDITTTSRQKIIEDDARYKFLVKFLQKELKNIQNSWTELRNKEGAKKAFEMPAVQEWFNSLTPSNQKRARSLFGKINQLTVDSDEEKRRLFKHSILAFESLRYKQNLEAIDALSPENLAAFAEIFSDLDDIEATLYHQIVNERIQVIEALQEKVEANDLEKIIQKHLFEHLWLLDPAWERTTGTEYMEQQVEKEFGKIDAKLTADEKKGRLDIKYRSTSGKHIIIELKRADRKLSGYELLQQTSKYRNALRKILTQMDRPHEGIEVVCVVGQPLSDWDEAGGRKESADMLSEKDTRVVTYQELLDNSYKAYQAYLDKKKEAGRILKVIQTIDEAELI